MNNSLNFTSLHTRTATGIATGTATGTATGIPTRTPARTQGTNNNIAKNMLVGLFLAIHAGANIALILSKKDKLVPIYAPANIASQLSMFISHKMCNKNLSIDALLEATGESALYSTIFSGGSRGISALNSDITNTTSKELGVGLGLSITAFLGLSILKYCVGRKNTALRDSEENANALPEIEEQEAENTPSDNTKYNCKQKVLSSLHTMAIIAAKAGIFYTNTQKENHISSTIIASSAFASLYSGVKELLTCQRERRATPSKMASTEGAITAGLAVGAYKALNNAEFQLTDTHKFALNIGVGIGVGVSSTIINLIAHKVIIDKFYKPDQGDNNPVLNNSNDSDSDSDHNSDTTEYSA